MNLVTAISLVTIVVAAAVAITSASVSRLPGWAAQRWLALVALTVAGYAALNVPLSAAPDGPLAFTLPHAPALLRLQVLIIGLDLWLWSRYAEAWLGGPPTATGRWAGRLALGCGALSLVPGLVFGDRVFQRVAGGLAYHEAALGPLGPAVTLLLMLAAVPLVSRFLGAWWAGVADGRLHAIAFLGVAALGAHDGLVTLGLLETPYLLDLGVGIPVGAVGLSTFLRLVRDAGALVALRGKLEAQVAERSRALARSAEALHRAEKLAAVGELAAGIAHEVNNPATAASVNVQYLAEQLRRGAPPADALAIADDALSALRRIGEITRRLTGAARMATATVELQDVPVRAAVEESLRLARARVPDHVRVAAGSLDGLAIRGDAGLLVQVLVNLVINGAQAVPPGRPGRVVVGAVRRGARVFITVGDDGDGMPPEVLARVFEPFFTTKPPGVGSGLGLAISRGLLATVGGDLRLESAPGQGTRATIDLPAPAPAPAD